MTSPLDLLEGSCGDISISWSGNFDSLTAIRGDDVDNAIGATDGIRCGQITFDGEIIKKKDGYTLQLDNGDFYGELEFTISTTLPKGMNETDEEAVKPYKDNTWTLKPNF